MEGDRRFHQIRLGIENMDKKDGEQVQDTPDCGSINDTADGHETDGRFYPIIFIRAVVKADNRLGAVCNAGHRHGDDFADGVDNRHDAYIKIPTVDGERGVADHLHNTVGDCHHEIGQPQSGDIADGFAAGTHTGYADAQDGLRAGKESHGPGCGS